MLCGLGWLSTRSIVLAHSGGNPYVLINGDYVKSNPLSGIQPNLAQDLAPANYTVGDSVDIAVDLNVFGAPGYQFRWLWGSKTDFSDGPKVDHTFDHPGTYLVTMQLRNASTDPSFTDTDTIGINVMPKPTYRVPTAQVQFQQTSQAKSGAKVKLSAVPATDPSTSIRDYQWTFADGESGQGQTVEHTYKSVGADFRIFPSLRITDGNGLYSDMLFEVDNNSGTLKALDAVSMPGVVTSSSQSRSSKVSAWLVVAALITVLSLAALIASLMRARKPTKSKA